jgi:ferredoxin-NADP reductase
MSIVKKYKADVTSIINHTEGIYTVEFSYENGKFKYHPGQFLHLALDPDYDGSDQWPESRCFSIQTNPDEQNIKITFSKKGVFTRQMEQKMKVGSKIWLKLPYGNLFTQPHNKQNTVFIAGGTGITPFLSLFTHDSFKEYIDPRIYLGFKAKEYNIYIDELNRSRNSSRHVKSFYEDVDGIIDIRLIIKENNTASDYFISGPPTMIKTFKQILIEKNVPVSQILTDDWE